MHWYKRNIGDYHKKAGRLTMLQHGAYTLLMDACYDREKFPTKQEAIEWLWTSTVEEVQAVEFVLARFFTLDGEIYVQHRISEELGLYNEKAEKNRIIALEREAKRRESKAGKHDSCTDGKRDVHETPPNQEPITSNQEPVTNKDKDIGTTSSKLNVPLQQVLDAYHEILPMMAAVQIFSDKRKTLVRNFWKKRTSEYKAQGKEYGIEQVRGYLSYIAGHCQWMLEDRPNGKGGFWKAKNFDYVFKDDCYIAVKEQRHDSRG